MLWIFRQVHTIAKIRDFYTWQNKQPCFTAIYIVTIVSNNSLACSAQLLGTIHLLRS